MSRTSRNGVLRFATMDITMPVCCSYEGERLTIVEALWIAREDGKEPVEGQVYEALLGDHGIRLLCRLALPSHDQHMMGFKMIVKYQFEPVQ